MSKRDIIMTSCSCRDEHGVDVVGDQHKALVTWKGQDGLGFKDGEAIALRFRLDRASIFALEFE